MTQTNRLSSRSRLGIPALLAVLVLALVAASSATTEFQRIPSLDGRFTAVEATQPSCLGHFERLPVNQPTWTPVEIRIRRPDEVSADAIRRRFPTFFQSDGEDFVFRSALDEDASISDHLKWLYGMIQYERKVFRQFEAAGVSAAICIRAQD